MLVLHPTTKPNVLTPTLHRSYDAVEANALRQYKITSSPPMCLLLKRFLFIFLVHFKYFCSTCSKLVYNFDFVFFMFFIFSTSTRGSPPVLSFSRFLTVIYRSTLIANGYVFIYVSRSECWFPLPFPVLNMIIWVFVTNSFVFFYNMIGIFFYFRGMG